MGKVNLFSRIGLVILINFFIFLCLSNKVNAQDRRITFNNLNIEQGISQSTIDVIFQDSKGYVWFGTNDGLNKYNGYDFKVYNYEYGENSISNNYISDIDEDSHGNMWITTIGGVSKLNPKNDEIKNYKVKDNSIGSNNAMEVLVTNENKVLVATDEGLYLYEENLDKFKKVLGENNDINCEYIYSIDQDSEGNIWLGLKKGVIKVSKNFKIIKTFPTSTEKNSLGEGEIYNVYCDDENGYVWVGSASSGLSKINTKTDEITRYTHDLNDSKSIPNDNIGCIKKDSRGNVWIGTANGLAKYNKQSDNFNVYHHKIYDKNSLVNNNIKSLMEDSKGLIWVGTYSGISIFDTDSKINHYKAGLDDNYLLNENIVHGVYEDEDGYLWVGTNSKGVNIIDRKNNTSKQLNSSIDKAFKNDSVNDITGKGNIIYIATDNGLIKLDKSRKILKNYSTKDGLVDNKIKDVMIDSKGYLWIGTTDGLSILNPETDEVIDINKIINENINKGKNQNNYIRHIYEDKQGNYYLGLLKQNGLCVINPKDKTIKHYKHSESDNESISDNHVRYINEDSKGNIWVGTSYGLNKLDKKSGKFKRYTTKNGIANNTIYGVLVDNDDNIWISTNKGISKIDSNNDKIINLSVTDGLQGNEFNGNAAYKNKKGELFFGGVNGLNSFYPNDIIKSGDKPKVLFDKFLIDNKEFHDINNKKFSEGTNTISIKFFTPNYSSEKSTTYEYRLEGGSGGITRTKDNHVTYNDLQPGNYTFKVKAIDTSGNVSDESQVSFSIKPPFWLSGYACLIYILIVIAFIINHKYKVKKLDKLVQKKTLRLREEMERNTVLLNKNIKLEKNKNNYFVNLSHELRTPLNVISSTNQLILGLMKKDEGIKEDRLNHYIDVSQRNCKRLLNLINNIVDSTKLQNDMYVISLKKVDIVYLVEETALTLIDYVSAKGIDLIIDPEIEEKTIMCDSYEIERCIVNLVGNAAKFTPEGGTITITIKDLDDKVKIIVSDTGVGIDEKYHKAIFDRFSQVVDINNEVKAGSGLGLTITNHIIKLHNGEIYVESKLGEGSNFIIILPVTQNTKSN